MRQTAQVATSALLLLVAGRAEAQDKKEEEEKKKKDGEKKKSHSGPSDIIGNALILTFIQMAAIPGVIYFWGLAMQSLKAAIVP